MDKCRMEMADKFSNGKQHTNNLATIIIDIKIDSK
jgi:hypothetical protein